MNINVQPPTTFTGIRITKPQNYAGGLPAVITAGQHVFKELNLKRCATTLFQVNQMAGFDCPGCA